MDTIKDDINTHDEVTKALWFSEERQDQEDDKPIIMFSHTYLPPHELKISQRFGFWQEHEVTFVLCLSD